MQQPAQTGRRGGPPAPAASASPIFVTHNDPAGCHRGYYGAPCPACADWLRHRHEAMIAVAEASDAELAEAMKWMVDAEPSHVIRALDAVRGTV